MWLLFSNLYQPWEKVVSLDAILKISRFILKVRSKQWLILFFCYKPHGSNIPGTTHKKFKKGHCMYEAVVVVTFLKVSHFNLKGFWNNQMARVAEYMRNFIVLHLEVCKSKAFNESHVLESSANPHLHCLSSMKRSSMFPDSFAYSETRGISLKVEYSLRFGQRPEANFDENIIALWDSFTKIKYFFSFDREVENRPPQNATIFSRSNNLMIF